MPRCGLCRLGAVFKLETNPERGIITGRGEGLGRGVAVWMGFLMHLGWVVRVFPGSLLLLYSKHSVMSSFTFVESRPLMRLGTLAAGDLDNGPA
jgi:hypothetical protein